MMHYAESGFGGIEKENFNVIDAFRKSTLKPTDYNKIVLK